MCHTHTTTQIHVKIDTLLFLLFYSCKTEYKRLKKK